MKGATAITTQLMDFLVRVHPPRTPLVPGHLKGTGVIPTLVTWAGNPRTEAKRKVFQRRRAGPSGVYPALLRD